MATNPEEQHEKEGICVADVVKCGVLAWSATLLTISYLGIYPQMKMDNTFVALCLLARWLRLASNVSPMAMETRSRLLLTTKTPKSASNDPDTFGIGHHFGGCIAC